METSVSRDGTPIAYSLKGDGPPLLLVHGTTANHERWEAIVPRFTDRFTVASMDRRGRGGSGDAPGYDLLREAEDIASVIDALGSSVSVLAHSYGALCSLEAALLTSGIDRMILYEPPVPGKTPIIAPGVPEKMQDLIDKGDAEEALVLFMREGPKLPEDELAIYRQLPMWPQRVELVPTVPRELTFDKTYHFDETRFSDLDIPILLLVGSDSPPMFHDGAARLDAALPNSRIEAMEGQQHIAMDLAPDLFVEKVSAFLN